MTLDDADIMQADSLKAAKIEQLEAELESLRYQLAEKDRELESRSSAKDVYHIVEPAVAIAQRVHETTANLPVVGRFVRFGVLVADVGVRRFTPWKSCADLGAKVSDIAPYLDEKVVSPQINTCREVVMALCRPTYEASVIALEPYEPYMEKARTTARPFIDFARPYVLRAMRIARPIALKVWDALRPLCVRLRGELQDEAEKADAIVGDTLDKLDAATVFENLKTQGEAVTEFAKAHAGDAANIMKMGADLLSPKHGVDNLDVADKKIT